MKASAVLLFISAIAFAPLQTATAQTPPATAQPAAASGDQLLKADQLDQLVAPIALYPDALLAEILMASTYPLEIVQADRWAKANKSLKGDQLKVAVDKQSWENSVKSLVATPQVLSDMSTKLDWTQKLGDAVLAQQADVMDAVQRLRKKAQASNALATTKQQKVSVQKQENKDVIIIEPAVPDTIYVPYYDPVVVYGAWAYPAYPPYYFPPPGYIAAGVIRTGLVFGAGYALGRWASGGNYWGGGCNWGNNNININRNVNININNNNNWQHNSAHRGGVKYNNKNVQKNTATTTSATPAINATTSVAVMATRRSSRATIAAMPAIAGKAAVVRTRVTGRPTGRVPLTAPPIAPAAGTVRHRAQIAHRTKAHRVTAALAISIPAGSPTNRAIADTQALADVVVAAAAAGISTRLVAAGAVSEGAADAAAAIADGAR